jgi:hypothetical protein
VLRCSSFLVLVKMDAGISFFLCFFRFWFSRNGILIFFTSASIRCLWIWHDFFWLKFMLIFRRSCHGRCLIFLMLLFPL